MRFSSWLMLTFCCAKSMDLLSTSVQEIGSELLSTLRIRCAVVMGKTMPTRPDHLHIFIEAREEQRVYGRGSDPAEDPGMQTI